MITRERMIKLSPWVQTVYVVMGAWDFLIFLFTWHGDKLSLALMWAGVLFYEKACQLYRKRG